MGNSTSANLSTYADDTAGEGICHLWAGCMPNARETVFIGRWHSLEPCRHLGTNPIDEVLPGEVKVSQFCSATFAL
jgi:hypothetical protein